MAAFHVGQRVFIKWSTHFPELANQVGTIVSQSDSSGLDGTSEWDVAPDCWGSTKSPNKQFPGYFAPNSSQLEPATNSYDKCSWDECVWKPEHLRETL